MYQLHTMNSILTGSYKDSMKMCSFGVSLFRSLRTRLLGKLFTALIMPWSTGSSTSVFAEKETQLGHLANSLNPIGV
jgi:hypothetical protein